MERSSFPSALTFDAFKSLGYEIMVPLCFGSLLHALLWALLAYALTLRFIPALRVTKFKRWPRRHRKFEE